MHDFTASRVREASPMLVEAVEEMSPSSNRRKISLNPVRVGTAVVACALVLVGLLVLPRSASSNEPVSIERVVREVIESNPSLLAARQKLEIARGRLVRAQYWNPFNPEVEGSLGERRFDGGGSDTQTSAGIALEIEVAGQRGKRIEEAERNLARVEAEVADAERRALAEAKDAFYGALYLGERFELFTRVEVLNQRLRDASSERFQAGESPKLEANLGVVRFARSHKDALAAERDHRNRLRALERLLGREPTGTLEIVGKLEIPSVDLDSESLDSESLVEIALRSRPDLRAATAEIERVDAEIALTRRSIAPNPTLRGIYDEEAESGGSRDRIFGGGVSIPIPLFDRNQGELVSLSGERGRAVAERAVTALEVETEVRDAWRSYTAAQQAVRTFEDDAASRIEESHRFLETAYREGKLDLISLISGQNDLIDAELSYLESISDYWMARVALERAIGADLDEGATP